MIRDNLVNDRIAARRPRSLEKSSCKNEQSTSRAGGKDQPWRKSLPRRSRFASERGAHAPAQMRRSAIRCRVVRQGLAQGVNLLIDGAALRATLQVSLDFARVRQVQFAIGVSVKQLASLIVVDAHFVSG